MDDERIKFKLKLASAFISEGKNLHAVQVYLNLIEETEREEIYFHLAELYEDMGFIDSGKNILSNLVRLKNNNDATLYFGQYLLRNSRWIEAIEILNSISETTPAALFLIAYSYMMLNEFELAKEYFADFITFDEKNDLKQEANLYLAKIEYELRNYNSALNYATNAQYLYSDFWELNLILAKVYYSLDMFTHAVNPIQKALKLNPKDASVQEFAGKIYYQLQDFKKAEKYFSEFIDLSSEVSAEIYTLLAKSFLKQRKMEEANLFFELALQTDPAYQPAIAGKGALNK
ncbi:MAG: tetratricopeptide repeat protein [Ignavibacteriales bacterium]|nr:tetratricopeptide repeat protein [Ignavibacteriales bacterium]